MRPITDFSTETLEKELERRKNEKEVPDPLPVFYWSKLIELLYEAVSEVDKNKFVPKDLENYIFEAAFEAVYGKEFWKWWNAKVG